MLRKLEFTCCRMVLHEFNKPMFELRFEYFHSRNSRHSKIALLVIVGQTFHYGCLFNWTKIVPVQMNDQTIMKMNT